MLGALCFGSILYSCSKESLRSSSSVSVEFERVGRFAFAFVVFTFVFSLVGVKLCLLGLLVPVLALGWLDIVRSLSQRGLGGPG
jgi:hypothetical protein